MKKIIKTAVLSLIALFIFGMVSYAEIYSDGDLITFDEYGTPILDEFGNKLEFGMKIDNGYVYVRSDGTGGCYGIPELRYSEYFDDCCKDVKKLYIDGNASFIADDTFVPFTSLEEVTLNTSVNYIGTNAFAGCRDAVFSFVGEKGEAIAVDKGNDFLFGDELLEKYSKVIFHHSDGIRYYLEGKLQVGYINIEGTDFYASRITGIINQKPKLTIGGVEHFFNDDFSLKDGEFEEGGVICRYDMGKKYIGWYDSDGDEVKDTYYLYANGAKVTNDKKIGGREYAYVDGKLVVRNGLTTINGKTYFFVEGIKQGGYVELEGKMYYFFRESGERVEASTYKIGGFIRQFNSDHSVKPLSGWQEKNGYKYYYVDGQPSLGFTEIEGKTYYFFKSDDKFGVMADGWQSIGGKVYYFFRYGTPKHGTMAVGKQVIGGVTYYFNSTGSINTGFIGDANGNRYYYYQSNKLHGWYLIGGKTYYFTLVEGYMIKGTKSIGGVTYEFGEDGALISPYHDAKDLGNVGGADGNGFDIGSGDWSDIEFI